MMRNTLYNKKGFTLIEIIIGLAILGIIAISFLTAFTAAYAFIHSAGRKSYALHDTEKQLETSIATGTEVDSETLTIAFSSGDIQLKGKEEEKNKSYDNGSKIVKINSFISKDSVTGGINSSGASMPLQIYANELNLRIGDTFLLEANKSVAWTTSDPSIASVASDGLITAHSNGTATITATSSISETQQCIVTVGNTIILREVKGGQYVSYGGHTYQKLTGANGRVVETANTAYNANWNASHNIPFMGELEGDNWAPELRNVSGMEYWTKTSPNASTTYYVTGAGVFDTKHRNNDKSGLRFSTDLAPTLKVSSGAGTMGSPYILVE